MQNQNCTLEREHILEKSIQELEQLNKKLAKFIVRKEELTNEIIGAIGHEHEGQKSYEYNVWKIEVKTPFIYSLNKRCYESHEFNLPEKFNPIKESVSYTIDKRLCDKYIAEAPKEVRDTLAQLIDKKPGKASIVIKERTQ